MAEIGHSAQGWEWPRGAQDTWFETIEQMQTVLDDYLVGYNTKRPHQGRGMNGRRLKRLRKKGFGRCIRRIIHGTPSNPGETQSSSHANSFPPEFFLQLAGSGVELAITGFSLIWLSLRGRNNHMRRRIGN